MIQGHPSNRQPKQVSRQFYLAATSYPAIPEFLRGSEIDISFSREDHPPAIPRPGHTALVLEARIGNYDMSRVFMDGGSGINIIFTKTLEEMFKTTSILKTSSTTFHGIIPG